MKVSSVTTWDDAFFERFGQLSPENENVRDLQKLWSADGAFAKLRLFKAYLLENDEGPVARALISVAKENPQFAALGYYQRRRPGAGQELLKIIESEYVAQFQRPELPVRAPVDGHFFNSYRLKVRGGDAPFYGEPETTPEMAEDFLSAGFQVYGQWRTVEIGRDQAYAQFDRIWKSVEPRWEKSGMSIRTLSIGNWESELRTLYNLLKESFNQMPNYEHIPWEEFRVLFADMKYVIDPRLVFFAEDERGVQGFAVTIKDSLQVIQKLRQQTLKHPFWKPLIQLWTLQKLKFHRGRLLVLYVGKRPAARAPWIGAALGRKIVEEGIRQGYKSALICYVAEDSPILANLPARLREVSRYELYEKTGYGQ